MMIFTLELFLWDRNSLGVSGLQNEHFFGAI
ncbi:hypothetical protein LINPERHAP1_LOCUS24249 [Linum perenne]